jgi:hypothetical protein
VWDEIAIGLEEEGFLVRGEDKRVTCYKTKWENLRRDSLNSARLVVGPTIQVKIPKILTRLKKLLVCLIQCVCK